jgi:hypothetical protein
MSNTGDKKRWLDPMDRSMEALFGLIMVLSFTGSLSVWTAGRQDVRDMLIGALGCNLAWGVIDACFYLMGILAERGRGRKLVERLRTSRRDEDVAAILGEAMPEAIVHLMDPAERTTLRDRVFASPLAAKWNLLTWADIRAAVAVFLWVLMVTFPVALPFALMDDAVQALRISNGIAIVLLGLIGWRLSRYAGFRAWITILSMVLFGSLTVAFTIALGG